MGLSIIGARMEDGDVLVVEEDEDPPYRTVVVASLNEGEEVTVKKLYRQGEIVKLKPQNGEHEDRKLEIDPDADWRINGIAGASRIVIAVIRSIFVYFAIVSGLMAISIESSNTGIFAISIAAGFSETFVSNILRQITQEDTSQR